MGVITNSINFYGCGSLISRSALAVAKGQTRLVDVLSILVSRRNLTHDSGTNEHHKTSTAQKFNRTDQPVVDTDRTSIPDVSTNFANDLGQSENITVKSSCDAICECSPDQKLCCASNVKSCTEHYNATEVEISYPRNEIESDIHSNQAKSAGKRAFKMACEASPYLAEVALDSVGFGLGSVLTSMIPGGDEDDDGSDSSSKSEDGDSSDSSNDRSSDDGRDVCVSPEQHLYALVSVVNSLFIVLCCIYRLTDNLNHVNVLIVSFSCSFSRKRIGSTYSYEREKLLLVSPHTTAFIY